MQRPPNGSQPPPYGVPPQQPQYGAPQQPQYGAPPQPQYGAPQQPQYGAPQQPQYGAPQQPQYGVQAQFAPGYGPSAPYPPQPQMPYGAPPPYGAPSGPVASVGLFGPIPCPHCGIATTSHAEGASAAQWAGGLVGWLLVSALSSKHYCVNHGEIPKAGFPPAHQSAMTMRMVMKLGAGGALLVFVFGLMIVSSIFG